MSRKKQQPSSQRMQVGDLSEISGNVNIAGGDIIQDIRTGPSAAEIKQWFDPVYARIAARPRTAAARKKQLTSEVEEIQETVTAAAKKNGTIAESFFERHFRNIARMAPDVLDVIVATLGNPLAGLGVAVKKIAEKAKEEGKP